MGEYGEQGIQLGATYFFLNKSLKSNYFGFLWNSTTDVHTQKHIQNCMKKQGWG